MVIKITPLASQSTMQGASQNNNYVQQTLANYQANMANQSKTTNSGLISSMANHTTNVVNNISLDTSQLSNAIRVQNQQLINSVNASIANIKNTQTSQDSMVIANSQAMLRTINEQTSKSTVHHREQLIANKDNVDRLSKTFEQSLSKLGNVLDDKLKVDSDQLKAHSKDIFFTIFEELISRLGESDVSMFPFQLLLGDSFETLDYEYILSRVRDFLLVLDKLDSGDYDSIDSLISDLTDDNISANIVDFIIKAIGLAPIGFAVFNAINSKALTELGYLANRNATPNIPTWLEIMSGLRRGVFTEDNALDMMLNSGWSENDFRLLFDLSQNIPSPNELFELTRRGFISEDKLKDNLEANGYTPNWSEVIADLMYYIPTPQDVIRFSARDVFDTELAQLSGIFEGWDNPDYLEYTRRAGIRDDDARLYWGAHWFLPSVNQGYEMLFRQQINRDELEALFRAADIAPAWREKLLNIAYKVPTRVDTRRMFIADVLNEQQTLDIIKAQGYNDTNAQFLLEWYIQEKNRINAPANEIREYTQATILKLYRMDLMSDNDAIQRLVRLGYNSQDAALLLLAANTDSDVNESVEYIDRQRRRIRNIYEKSYMNRFISRNEADNGLRQTGLNQSQSNALLDLLDREFEIEYRANIVEQTSKLYIGYEIDDNRFRITLNQYGFSSQEIENLLDKYAPMRELRYRDLTTKQISDMVISNILTYDEGMNQLRGNGFSDKDAILITRLEGWLENE